jgi:flagellar motor switch protein FliM
VSDSKTGETPPDPSRNDLPLLEPRSADRSGLEEEQARAWEATVTAALDVAARVTRGEDKDVPGMSSGRAPGPEPANAASGMERMLLSGVVAYERLPMLEIVFDRLVRGMSTSLRNFTSDNVEVMFRGLSSLRFGDYLESIPNPSILGVFKAEQWDNYGLLMVDAPLIYSMVDVLLGGRSTSTAAPATGRAFTMIERQLVERMVDVVLRDLSDAFAPLTEVRFHFDRLEVIGRFATISRPSNAAALASLHVNMDGRGGAMQILLPYATLEPVRELLLQQYMGETLGRDSIWETHLAEEMMKTDIVLDAVLDEQIMDFESILALRVGDTLPLNVSPGTLLQLRCGPISMFEGRTGRRGTRLAVLIDRVLSQPAESQT